jgi:thiamine-monophosphate kinase
MMEQSFVAWAKVRAARLPQVKLGIGDDAAVLAGNTQDWVITTDCLMDGVHFRLQETNPRRIGRKLVNVNLSDLAAMAAQPVAVFLTLCMKPSVRYVSVEPSRLPVEIPIAGVDRWF